MGLFTTAPNVAHVPRGAAWPLMLDGWFEVASPAGGSSLDYRLELILNA